MLSNKISNQSKIIQEIYDDINLARAFILFKENEFTEFKKNYALNKLIYNSMSLIVLNLYKLLSDKKDEKHSLNKILNILTKNYKPKNNFDILRKKYLKIKKDYDNSDLEIIRSKYLAHLDTNTPRCKSSILFLEKTIQEILKLHNEVRITIKLKEYKISHKSSSIQNLFDKVRKLDDEINYDNKNWKEAFGATQRKLRAGIKASKPQNTKK